MKSSEKNKIFVDIIYPCDSNDASADDLALCEGFIAKILLSSETTIKITINTSLRLIESNDPSVKQYLDLILKSKRINSLYRQFKNLLFDQKILKLSQNERIYEINIREAGVYPDFTWMINKIS